jgi:hypothetical protein
MMIPNKIIFNPSLYIPQGAPINKPETNPPHYDMSSLIQAMQPAQPQPTPALRALPTSIMDQIQQVTTNISTNKDKIKDQIKPINPVIPEPIPQYVPNPQSDQSHPIPPDIIIDSNISTPIHNKHMAHKNLKNIIQPQTPEEKIIKDPEGLGAKIPIQNIEALGANISLAALTGGATAAGQAVVGGGIAGLMASAEAIIGATIGSGVAAGASTAFGNTTAGNIASGIAGGVAGGLAGKAIKKSRTSTNEGVRINTQEEQVPLLNGNRLGGRGARSRLVGENPSSQIPEYQLPKQKNSIDIIKEL